MVSIIIHFLLGLAASSGSSRPTRRSTPGRPAGRGFSPLECVYYAAGIASIALGYYFNIHFVLDAHWQGNPISGPAS